jgi:hypothetical protein
LPDRCKNIRQERREKEDTRGEGRREKSGNVIREKRKVRGKKGDGRGRRAMGKGSQK